jgi:hypothetical protein
VLEIVQKIKDAEDSSGVGYYTTYLVDKMVIKVYDIKADSYYDFYREDIRKHVDLDDTKLIPKMITNFIHDDCGYLVVERIKCLNDKFRKGRSENYYDLNDMYMPDDFEKNVEELRMYLEDYGYCLDDEHIGNFGWSGKYFMCLDEGCLSYM